MIKKDIENFKLEWYYELLGFVLPVLMLSFGLNDILTIFFELNKFHIVIVFFCLWLVTRGLLLNLVGFIPKEEKHSVFELKFIILFIFLLGGINTYINTYEPNLESNSGLISLGITIFSYFIFYYTSKQENKKE